MFTGRDVIIVPLFPVLLVVTFAFLFFFSDDSRQDASACQRLTVPTTHITLKKKKKRERKKDTGDARSFPACPQFPRKNCKRLSFSLRRLRLTIRRKIIKRWIVKCWNVYAGVNARFLYRFRSNAKLFILLLSSYLNFWKYVNISRFRHVRIKYVI